MGTIESNRRRASSWPVFGEGVRTFTTCLESFNDPRVVILSELYSMEEQNDTRAHLGYEVQSMLSIEVRPITLLLRITPTF